MPLTDIEICFFRAKYAKNMRKIGQNKARKTPISVSVSPSKKHIFWENRGITEQIRA